MSTSREKFQRWLKHAEQLEAEMKRNAPPPANLGLANAEPWTPQSPDPFRMGWDWLSERTEPVDTTTQE